MSMLIDHTNTTMQLSRLLRKLDKGRARSLCCRHDRSWVDNINS
ncbi:hypothetical protein [Zhongshania sp.]|nr:hypothetical protein [Zhongshania sp.]